MTRAAAINWPYGPPPCARPLGRDRDGTGDRRLVREGKTMQRITAVLAAVAAIVLAYAYPANALSSPPRNQCVVHVVGHRASGELVLSRRHCYTSFLGAMRAEG